MVQLKKPIICPCEEWNGQPFIEGCVCKKVIDREENEYRDFIATIEGVPKDWHCASLKRWLGMKLRDYFVYRNRKEKELKASFWRARL
jgi:hypothetical protein